MNEEELKKGCGEDFSHPCSAFRMCRKGDLCPICQAKLEGFQKGKLEQKKEFDNALIKYSKLRLYRSRSCQLLIKQLQKEIGGMK